MAICMRNVSPRFLFYLSFHVIIFSFLLLCCFTNAPSLVCDVIDVLFFYFFNIATCCLRWIFASSVTCSTVVFVTGGIMAVTTGLSILFMTSTQQLLMHIIIYSCSCVIVAIISHDHIAWSLLRNSFHVC